MANEDKIEIPAPPSGLPDKVAKRWKATYEDSFREAREDYPEDVIMHKQVALREANKTLRFDDPESYQDAMRLEEWHCILREPDKDGKVLRVVTRHGKKFAFPIPPSAQRAPEKPPAA